jgi:transposase-like protein
VAKLRRSFSAELKAKVVLELLSGAASVAELARRYQVKPQLLAIWKRTFLDRMPLVFGAEDPAERTESRRVAELEQLVGRQALELEVLKKASRWLTGRPPTGGRSS